MNTENEQVGMNQLSETELNQVIGGISALDFVDTIFAAFVGRDSDGNGPIKHFLGNGGHYKN